MTVIQTVQDEGGAIQYTGNGVQTFFEYPYELLPDSILLVTVNDISVSNYATHTNGITFNTAPPAGAIIILMRSSVIDQLRDWEPFDDFPAAKTEEACDKLILLKQEAVYRGKMNLSLVIDQDSVEVHSDKGDDADMQMWAANTGVVSGLADTDIPPDGSFTTTPTGYFWMQHD